MGVVGKLVGGHAPARDAPTRSPRRSSPCLNPRQTAPHSHPQTCAESAPTQALPPRRAASLRHAAAARRSGAAQRQQAGHGRLPALCRAPGGCRHAADVLGCRRRAAHSAGAGWAACLPMTWRIVFAWLPRAQPQLPCRSASQVSGCHPALLQRDDGVLHQPPLAATLESPGCPRGQDLLLLLLLLPAAAAAERVPALQACLL